MSITESGPSVPSDIPFSLGRNAACHRCRRRKMRCDAVRPVCSNCRKLVQKKRLEGTVCTWDEKKDTRSRSIGTRPEPAQGVSAELSLPDSRPSGSRGVISESQAPSLTSSTDYGQSSKSSSKDSSYPSGREQSWNVPLVQEFSPTQLLIEPHTLPLTESPAWSPLSHVYDPSTGQGRVVPTVTGVTEGDCQEEEAESTGEEDAPIVPTADITIPRDWPKELPSPATVRGICTLFFDHVPTLPKMFHRSTLFKALRLSPTSEDWPAQYLLHAILAISATHFQPSAAFDRAYFPIGTPVARSIHPTVAFGGLPPALQSLDGTGVATRPITDFVLWHRHHALSLSSRVAAEGETGVKAVQTRCIIAALDHVNAWWTNTGQECGALRRSALLLQRTNDPGESIPNPPGRSLGGEREHGAEQTSFDSSETTGDNTPTATAPDDTGYDLSRAVQDRTRWMCWLTEREISISSSPVEASSDGIESLVLPVIQKRVDADKFPLKGVQTLGSIDISSDSPLEHFDGLSYLIKAVRLFFNVKNYYDQFSQGSHTISDFLSNNTFKHLVLHINAMRASSPRHVGRSTNTVLRSGDKLDVDLIAAVMITNLATVTLLEPCITTELYKSSIAQEAVSAIRGVINMVQDLHTSGFDITSLPSFCPLVWSLCARGLIKLINLAKSFDDVLGAGMYHSELEVFRLALIRYRQRHPIAGRYLKDLEDGLQLLRAPRNITRHGLPAQRVQHPLLNQVTHGHFFRSQTMPYQKQTNQPAAYTQLPFSFPFSNYPGAILASTTANVNLHPQSSNIVETTTADERPRTAYDWAQALPPLTSLHTAFVERYNFGPYYGSPPVQQSAQIGDGSIAGSSMQGDLSNLGVPGFSDNNTGRTSGSVGDGSYGSFWANEPHTASSSIPGMLSAPAPPPSSVTSPVNMFNTMSLAGQQNQGDGGQDMGEMVIDPKMREDLAGLEQWLNLLSQSPKDQGQS